jgi:acyl carrier protein
MTKTKKKLSPEHIIAKAHTILAEQLGVDETEITPDALFADDLGADSLDYVEVVMAFEEEFGIEINDADVDKMTRVRQMTDYLTRRLA